MRLLVSIEADDEAAALYIERLWAEYADDENAEPRPTPQVWFRERIQEFVEDEFCIAFMFTGPEVGLRAQVAEVVPSFEMAPLWAGDEVVVADRVET